MQLTKGQEHAAQAFITALLGDRPKHDDTFRRVEALARAAFLLYSLEWGKGFDIRRWQWPLNELAEGRDFSGLEPWAVLIAKAVELARQIAPER
jgi:hypothetical protein